MEVPEGTRERGRRVQGQGSDGEKGCDLPGVQPGRDAGRDLRKAGRFDEYGQVLQDAVESGRGR